MGIKHAHQTAVANNATKDVSADRWNADHTIDDESIDVQHLSTAVQATLTNARTPTAHTHPISEVINLQTTLNGIDGEIVDLQALIANVSANLLSTNTALYANIQSTNTAIRGVITSLDSAAEKLANKDQASGYAGLSAGSKIAGSQIPINGTSIVLDANNNLAANVADGGDWTTEVVKSTDQTVSGTTVLQNDTELKLAVQSGEVWLIEFLLVYTCNDAARDFNYNFSFPTGSGWYRYVSAFNVSDSLAQSTGVQINNGTSQGSDLSLGGDAGATKRVHWQQFFLSFSAAGDFQFKFANGLANAGNLCVTKAGSILRGKKLI